MAGQHRLSAVVVHNTRWWRYNKHRNKQERNNQGIVSSLFLKSTSNTHGPPHRRGQRRLEHQAIFLPSLFCLLRPSFLSIRLTLEERAVVGNQQRKYTARTLVLTRHQPISCSSKPCSSSQTTKCPGGGWQKLHQDTQARGWPSKYQSLLETLN